MTILAFILIVAIALGSIALPVVFALRRGARRAALVAAAVGLIAQAAFVTYLQAGRLGPEDGVLAIVIGVPAVAIATCFATMLVIARLTNRTKA